MRALAFIGDVCLLLPQTGQWGARSYEGNDTRFEYDASTLQVVSYPFEGFCIRVLIANGKSEFALLECSDHPRQKIIYNEADQPLRLNEDKHRCVAVLSETVPAVHG